MIKYRLRKELASLAPAWIAALVLAVLPALAFPRWHFNVWLALFALGALLLAVEAFGKEFSSGTFDLLLAQPVPRRRVWNDKMMALALTAASLLVGFLYTTLWRLAHLPFGHVTTGTVVAVTLVVLACAMAGGLAATLLFQHVAAGFWFAILAPGALLGITNGIRESFFPESSWPLWLVMGLYSIVALWVARNQFGRAQVTGWASRELSLPDWLSRSRSQARAKRPARSAVVSLLFKELHLQQINFLIAGFLTLLFVVQIAGRWLAGGSSASIWTNGLVGFLFLFLLMPFLVGAVTVAEERRLGVLGQQLSLPIHGKTKWRLKTLVVTSTSLLLGIVLPGLLAMLVRRILPMSWTPFLERLPAWKAVLGFWAIATVLGLYASSLARNLMHALSWPVLLLVPWAVIEGLVNRFQAYRPPPVYLFNLLTVVVFTVLCLVLAGRNFRLEVVARRDWQRNAACLAAGLLIVCGLTPALYNRVWEIAIPETPVRSDIELAGSVRPEMSVRGRYVTLLLPDGRLLHGRYNWPDRDGVRQPGNVAFHASPGRWKDLSGLLAVRDDGTLWSWPDPYASTRSGDKKKSKQQTGSFPVQIGTDKDWRAVASYGGSGFAIKHNGTLWALGQNGRGQIGNGSTEDKPNPVRIGNESNWASIGTHYATNYGLKTDGTLWGWGVLHPLEYGSTSLKDTYARAEVHLPIRIGNDSDWERAIPGNGFCIGLKKDGTAWVWGQIGNHKIGSPRVPLQFGPGKRWKAFAQGWPSYSTVAIAADGTLWQWDGLPRNGKILGLRKPGRVEPDQIGSRTNWIAAYYQFGLTADGGFWAWDSALGENALLTHLIPPSSRPHLIAVVPPGDQAAK